MTVVNVPDGWQQGKGAFGGLVLGTLVRAMEAHLPDPGRRLRVLTGDLAGPVLPGPAELRVEILRNGARITNVDARLLQGDRVQARASAVFSGAMGSSAAQVARTPPAAVDWASIEPAPVGPPFGPVFAQHYEYRVTGPFPLSGAPEPIAEGFIREKELPSRLDAAAIVGRIDAWWPALYAVEDQLRPMATVSFTFELFVDPSTLDPKLPLFHRARVVELDEGMSLEVRELWSGDLRVAMHQQTSAVRG